MESTLMSGIVWEGPVSTMTLLQCIAMTDKKDGPMLYRNVQGL